MLTVDGRVCSSGTEDVFHISILRQLSSIAVPRVSLSDVRLQISPALHREGSSHVSTRPGRQLRRTTDAGKGKAVRTIHANISIGHIHFH